MPLATSTFSVATQYRLEMTANVIGWNGSTLSVQQIVGIRRIVSGGAGKTGSVTISIGMDMSGETVPFTVNFTSTDYVELVNYVRQIGTKVSPWTGGNLGVGASSTVANNPTWGNASASLTLATPASSDATIPNFTPTSFNAGSAITINLPRKVSTYTHDLFYSFGSIVNEPITTGAGASYSFTPPAYLVNQIPTATSGPFTITAVTRSAAGSEIGEQSFTGTLNVPASSVPVVTAYSVTDANALVASEVGAFVEDLSVLRVDSITATPPTGSTISERRFNIEGAALRVADTKGLSNSGAIAVSAQAWDSRGRSGSLSGSINVLPYTGPSNRSRVYRATGGVEAEKGESLVVSLTYSNVKSIVNGTERNSMTARISTKVFGTDTWTVRNTVTPSTTLVDGVLATSASYVVGGGAIYSANTSYSVRVEIIDKFNVVAVEHTVATAFVTADLNGENVGIAKLHQRGALDVGGAGYFEGVYSEIQKVSNLNTALFSGRYAVDTATATNFPSAAVGPTGILDVDRFEFVAGTLDIAIQRFRSLGGGPTWLRGATVNSSTNVPDAWDPWLIDVASGGASGPYSALSSGVVNAVEGARYRDTTNGLDWVYTGGSWLLVPGQVLAVMESATSVTGGAAVAVGSIVSTPVLPVGQRLKISGSWSQYSTAVASSVVSIRARNNATNVSWSTYDKQVSTRSYSAVASNVHDSVSPTMFMTTTTAAKVSVGLFLAAASSGVFGTDGITVWVESA